MPDTINVRARTQNKTDTILGLMEHIVYPRLDRHDKQRIYEMNKVITIES